MGLALSPKARPGPGSTDNVWGQARFGHGSNDSNQTYRTSWAFSGFFFYKEKVIRSCVHLMLVTQSEN
jgi:hypothetical protein